MSAILAIKLFQKMNGQYWRGDFKSPRQLVTKTLILKRKKLFELLKVLIARIAV